MEEFDYLTDYRGDPRWSQGGIHWDTRGCGCCADGATVKPGEEVKYIDQYITQLSEEIAKWQAIRKEFLLVLLLSLSLAGCGPAPTAPEAPPPATVECAEVPAEVPRFTCVVHLDGREPSK